MIKLRGIKKDFGSGRSTNHALKGVDLDVEKGDFVAIMGSSGSGKSTLLSILGGMDRATSGEYYYDEIAVHELNSSRLDDFRINHISFVFQNFALMNQFSVMENAELPLLCKGVKRKERRRKTTEVLERLGIRELKDRTVSQISGGEQQRCAIARAFLSENQLVLCDEPTGALDKKNGVEIMKCLKEINEVGKTIIMVTHDDSIAAWAKHRYYMEDGQLNATKKE